MVNINGMAHIQLSVLDMDRSVPFYRRLLNSLSMQTIVDSDDYFYCVGGRTGLAISAVAPEFKDTAFEPRRAGLHHVCFRARSREDVDETFKLVERLDGARIVHGPQEDNFAPGYYSILFEDPDGIRIEVNHVPGKGHLDPNARLPLADTVSEA